MSVLPNMQMLIFSDRLRSVQQQNNSWLCIGLDPSEVGHRDYGGLVDFCEPIIAATSDLVSAYKLNFAFFLRHGDAGLNALERIVDKVPDHISLILDAKFGDIGNSAGQYAGYIERFANGAITLNPYIGTDALRPFLADESRMIFALCRTSNVDGNEFQTLDVGGKPLYQHVAAKMSELGDKYPGQVGLVVGATQPDDLRAVRQIAPKLPFLVPGIGTQGGDLEAVVQYGSTVDGIGPIINVGRAIIYAEAGQNFASAARAKAIDYRDQINRLRDKYG